VASFEIDIIYHQLLFDIPGSDVSSLKCVTWPHFSEESELCSTVELDQHLSAQIYLHHRCLHKGDLELGPY